MFRWSKGHNQQSEACQSDHNWKCCVNCTLTTHVLFTAKCLGCSSAWRLALTKSPSWLIDLFVTAVWRASGPRPAWSWGPLISVNTARLTHIRKSLHGDVWHQGTAAKHIRRKIGVGLRDQGSGGKRCCWRKLGGNWSFLQLGSGCGSWDSTVCFD